jgi:hypothetical protein
MTLKMTLDPRSGAVSQHESGGRPAAVSRLVAGFALSLPVELRYAPALRRRGGQGTSEPLKAEGNKKRHCGALDDDLGLNEEDDVEGELGP